MSEFLFNAVARVRRPCGGHEAEQPCRPRRIQLSRARGWRMPANTVKVSRGPGMKWGNPFRVGLDGDAEYCVHLFRAWVEAEFLEGEIRRELRGKNLACWCKPGTPCHADVLLEIANS
jgi:hypothetical protein